MKVRVINRGERSIDLALYRVRGKQFLRPGEFFILENPSQEEIEFYKQTRKFGLRVEASKKVAEKVLESTPVVEPPVEEPEVEETEVEEPEVEESEVEPVPFFSIEPEEDVEEIESSPDFEKMTKQELLDFCQGNEIEADASMVKAEIKDAIYAYLTNR